MNQEWLVTVAAVGLVVPTLVVMVVLVRWARRRSVAAITFGALMSVFAPDPTFEDSARKVALTRQEQEEDGEGEDC